MIKSFCNLLILFIMVVASISGVAAEFHDEGEKYTSQASVSCCAQTHDEHGHEHEGESDCEGEAEATSDGCDPDNCSPAGECCSGTCACATSVVFRSKKDQLSIDNFLLKKVSWFYYQDYNSPYLDPSLKPPLFS